MKFLWLKSPGFAISFANCRGFFLLKNNVIQKSFFHAPLLLKLKKKREWQDVKQNLKTGLLNLKKKREQQDQKEQQEKQLKKGIKRKNNEDVDPSKRRKKTSDNKGNNKDLDGDEKTSEKK